MAWKMTGQREVLQPVIDAYQRGEIPDREAELIADIAGLDPRQRGLIASRTNHLIQPLPEQNREKGLIARLTKGMGDGQPAPRPPSDVASSQSDVPLVGDLTTDTSVPVLGEPDKDPADLEKQTGGIDTDVIWDIESSKGTNMHSRAGAKGHHQFMPKTWPYVIKDMGKEGQEGWDWETGPMDFDKSTQASKHYFDVILPRELRAKGVPVNEKTLLAAYNAGAGTVSKTYKKHGAKWWEGHLPKETRNYIKKYEKRKKNG
jgi:hypothetical protein